MKVFLTILAVTTCVLAKEAIPSEEQMSDLVEECTKQYPIPAELKNKIVDSHIPNQELIRNYTLCMMRGVAFYHIYQEEIKKLREKAKEKSNNLAQFCMDNHFNFEEEAVNVFINLEDCVKNNAHGNIK